MMCTSSSTSPVRVGAAQETLHGSRLWAHGLLLLLPLLRTRRRTAMRCVPGGLREGGAGIVEPARCRRAEQRGVRHSAAWESGGMRGATSRARGSGAARCRRAECPVRRRKLWLRAWCRGGLPPVKRGLRLLVFLGAVGWQLYSIDRQLRYVVPWWSYGTESVSVSLMVLMAKTGQWRWSSSHSGYGFRMDYGGRCN
jgi:hypothetical protein